MAYYKCRYCGHKGNKRTRHKDHPVPIKVREERSRNPLARGHESGIYEVLPDTIDTCSKCNESKGAKTPGQWARWLQDHPDRWYPWEDGDRRPFINKFFHLL